MQIFDRTKRIIDQARHECYLWEHHLLPKFILNGIPPPPWLCNSSLHSFPSDPKDSNKDDTVSGILSQTQFGIPFPVHHCSLYKNLDVVTDDVQYPIGLCNDVHAYKKDHDVGDRLSNLPDCSVNNAGCASSGPPEFDSGAISPQHQIEPRVSEIFHDPAVSLAKMQRSRSRQKAMELRNSAKAAKRLSGDGNNAATATGSASSSLQEDHAKELGLVNEFHPNLQSCLMEEMGREGCQNQIDHRSNYSGRITRSKSSSQKLNSLSVGSSSVEKEDGPPLNDMNEVMELVNRHSFINGSCGVREANTLECPTKEVGSSVDDKRLTKPRTSSLAEHSSELLNLNNTSDRHKGVEVSDLKQPCSHAVLTDISKTSNCNNGSWRRTVKDGDFCQNKQESNIQSRLKLHGNSCPSPGDDFFTTDGSVKSIDQSLQSSRPLVLKNLQDPPVNFVGSFSSQKEPHICAAKTKEHLSRSGSGKAYLTKNSKLSKSPNSNSREQNATCSESAGKKSLNVQPTELDARRLSSSPKHSELDKEISKNSAEKENIAEVAASRNTRAVTSCVKEGSLRPVIFSNLDSGSLLAESRHIKTAVVEKDLDVQENIATGANPSDNAEHSSAATVAKVLVDFDGLVEKDPSCLGSRLTAVNPKVGEDVSVLRLPSDFVMSVVPKKLVFDEGEETGRDGISSPDLIVGRQIVSLEKEPVPLSEPLKLLDDETQEVITDSFSEAVPENGMHKHTDESVTNFTVRFPSGAPTDEVNVDLAQQAPNTIASGQNGELLRQTLLSNGKVTSFSADIHNFPSSTERFINDVEDSCSPPKKRKIEIETKIFLPDSTHVLEKLVDSIDQKPASGTLSNEEDNPETVIEVQHLASDHEDDIRHEHASNSPTDVMEDTVESQKLEGSSCEMRTEKLLLDGSGRSSETPMLAEVNPIRFSIDSMRFTMDEKAGSLHLQVNSGQDSAELVTCVERSTSSRRIFRGIDTELSDDLSVSPGIRDLDLIDTGEALPEFEGFIMQTDNGQPCTAQDQMELENMNLPSNSVDYSSLGRSSFKRSPYLYESVPNRLLEGYGLSSSLPLNDESPTAHSDYLPNCNGQYTSSVQSLWDKINLNFSSSGKRKSLKSELPCISEENENVDEIGGTFREGNGSEGMTGSITRGPLAQTVDNANPSKSVLEDALTSGCEDFLSTEFNLGWTHSKVKKKLDKQDGNRARFTSKGKENQSSVGANGAKRNSESVRKRSSRPKLSGKDSSMKQRPTYSGGKTTYKNIVSNVTSFIPLVQQKQAAAVITGKRDIKVKALEAAEAAKRIAEKKENERKIKKEALRLERERLEQQNLRQMELQKKKKEEERKKKEAEMAAKKRQRENEEKKEKERKRKRFNDMKQQEHGKIHAKIEEIKIQRRATGEEVHESRKIMDERNNYNNLQLQKNSECDAEKISETKPLTIRDSTIKTKESCLDNSESVNYCANKGKATMVDLIKAPEDNDLIIGNSFQEQSYEMSPYKSDDEDEDDVPNNKFIPSWASKHSLFLMVSSQKMDPERIFSQKTFCNIAKVLLPRKLQL